MRGRGSSPNEIAKYLFALQQAPFPCVCTISMCLCVLVPQPIRKWGTVNSVNSLPSYVMYNMRQLIWKQWIFFISIFLCTERRVRKSNFDFNTRAVGCWFHCRLHVAPNCYKEKRRNVAMELMRDRPSFCLITVWRVTAGKAFMIVPRDDIRTDPTIGWTLYQWGLGRGPRYFTNR